MIIVDWIKLNFYASVVHHVKRLTDLFTLILQFHATLNIILAWSWLANQFMLFVSTCWRTRVLQTAKQVSFLRRVFLSLSFFFASLKQVTALHECFFSVLLLLSNRADQLGTRCFLFHYPTKYLYMKNSKAVKVKTKLI